KLYLFTDTNFFLQLRLINDLPWHEAFPDREIILLVPRAVQKEIARLKSDGNTRRARRARSAAQILMRVAQAPDSVEIIREASPRVELRIPSRSQIIPVPGTEPNFSIVDDQIIDEIRAFRAEHQNEDVRFITTDSDQVTSARYFG